MLFRRQYFFQEAYVRFYFLVEITAGKASINWLTDKGFHILVLNTYQITCYSYLLNECKTGTFWLTDRDAGTEPFKPGLSRLKRDVWYAYICISIRIKASHNVDYSW